MNPPSRGVSRAHVKRRATARTFPTPPVHLRRPPQKSTTAKAAERFTALLPAARKAARSGGARAGGTGAAGLAALAGAGALAFKYRERLKSLVARDGSKQQAAEPSLTTPDAGPATPVAEEPPSTTERPIPPGA